MAKCRRKTSAGVGTKHAKGKSQSEMKIKAKQGQSGEESDRNKRTNDKQSSNEDDELETTSAIAIALDLSWEEEWGVDSEDSPTESADPNGLAADLVQSIVSLCLSVLLWLTVSYSLILVLVREVGGRP